MPETKGKSLNEIEEAFRHKCLVSTVRKLDKGYSQGSQTDLCVGGRLSERALRRRADLGSDSFPTLVVLASPLREARMNPR